MNNELDLTNLQHIQYAKSRTKFHEEKEEEEKGKISFNHGFL